MRKTVMTLMTTMAGAGFAIAGLLPGTAVAQQGADPSSQRAAPAAEVLGDVKTATATVTGIDREKRTVTLKGEDGKTRTVDVPEDVQSFDQVKKGDKIRMTYQESAALDIYQPGEARPEATEKESTSRIAGSSPGRMVEREQTIAAEIISVDPKKNIVKVKGPEGKAKEISVQSPEVRQKLKDLKPGQVVQIRYKEAMAVTLEPQK
jgi:Cu/Ag efflux protein CusF